MSGQRNVLLVELEEVEIGDLVHVGTNWYVVTRKEMLREGRYSIGFQTPGTDVRRPDRTMNGDELVTVARFE